MKHSSLPKTRATKRRISFLLLVCLFASVTARPVSNPVYYQRLFYLCKAWGHCKYYHTAVAAGTVAWDQALITAIRGTRNAPTDAAFADTVLGMIRLAGPMAVSSVPLPVIPDSLNNNADLGWMLTPLFSDSVRARLDTITHRFRPQANLYAGNPFPGDADFSADTLFYHTSGAQNEERRLLALFRYWNIIHYFYPYKDIIGRPWDSTLAEFIPRLSAPQGERSYTLTMKELTCRIHDSHASFTSPDYLAWRGVFYPPFQVRFIENEMVVTRVLAGTLSVTPGDVIKKIDGQDVYKLRDSLRRYAHGSNAVNEERILNSIILYGDSGTFPVTLQNGTGIREETLSRNATNYAALNVNPAPAWRDTVLNASCRAGIINMGKLQVADIAPMFSRLWTADLLLFDIRNYPNGTLTSLANYLYDTAKHITNLKLPDVMYPGRFSWREQFTGDGSDSLFPGRITLLFDERTVSQAEWTCMGIEPFPRTSKVGSTTAAADGGNQVICLPGRIQTYATMQGVFYPDYRPTQRIGILPDFSIVPTIAGVRSGHDEVMEFALTCTLGTGNEKQRQPTLRLFPNPASGRLEYQSPNDRPGDRNTIEITDITGNRLVYLPGRPVSGTVDVSGLPAGCYLFRLIGAGAPAVGKFMKTEILQ